MKIIHFQFHLFKLILMSTSNISQQYKLRVRVADEYKYLVKIIVFDSANRIVSPSQGSIYEYLYSLPKGLYTVRVEMNAEVNDKVIIVNSDKEYFITSDYSSHSIENMIIPPIQYSSALLGKTYGSSHEYYTYPAIEWSKRDTTSFSFFDPNTSNSSLFIFIRFPSIEKYMDMKKNWAKSFYKDFEIANEEGKPIFRFEEQRGIEVNENEGWLAFNAKLPNGIYYLIYHGDEPRQIPIYVFKNWHTQFFMTLGNVPLFGSTRIFISRQRVFNPQENTHKYIDILLDKLQNGDYSIDEELINMAAYGKYESPMLGLICSYIYLKSSETKSDQLFRIITQNLGNVILKDNDESPDIKALNILAADHFNNMNYWNTEIKGTPMLRVGFEAIKNASLKQKNLISKNSINDFISETLFYDSPFNTFKPIPFYKKEETSIPQNNIFKFTDNRPFSGLLANSVALEFDVLKSSKYFKPIVDEFAVSLKDYLNPLIIDHIKNTSMDSGPYSNWIRNSISDMLNSKENISINDISNQLNLSGNTITRIFDDWKNELKNKK